MKESEEQVERKSLSGALRGGRRYWIALALVALVLAWQADVFTPKIRAGESEVSLPVVGDAELVRVREVPGEHQRRLVGAVVPRARIELSARISGQVESVAVDSGDLVSAGDTVVRLDAGVPRARRDEAAAALAVAEAELLGARRLLRRIREAADARSIPETERIEAERARNAAAQAVKRAEAALSGAENQLEFTRIRSPVDGVVIERAKDPGDQVLPGRPVLFLYQPEHLEIAVNVPASLAGHFSPGAEISCRVPALGARFPARVRTRVPSADPATRSVVAKLQAALPEQAVPGLFVEANIAAAESTGKTLVIPATSVERVRQIPFVHVVGDDGRAFRRVVRLGREMGEDIVVLAGLESGDRVLRHAARKAGRGGEIAEDP